MKKFARRFKNNYFCGTLILKKPPDEKLYNTPYYHLVSGNNDNNYGAQLQNWCAQIDDEGILYFGNNSGLLTFDGYTWECTPLPRGTIVRSLLYDNGRLYAGTFEDFGYFGRNDKGELLYTSIRQKDKSLILENEEIWQISRLGRHIYFQSFNNIFVYEPESGVLSTLPARIAERPDLEGDGNMKPLFSYVICGHLYVLADEILRKPHYGSNIARRRTNGSGRDS